MTRRLARASTTAMAALVLACHERAAPPPPAPTEPPATPPMETAAASPEEPAQGASLEPSAAPEAGEDEPAFSACNAPSVTMLQAWDDARTLDALQDCLPDGGGFAEGIDAGFSAMATLEEPRANKCGTGDVRPPDIPRMIDSALPFDAETTAHVRAIFDDGRRKGRRAEVFGLVGDSLTLDYAFMKPFRVDTSSLIVLDPRVRDALSIDDGSRTVIDLFHGQAKLHGGSTAEDSFYAPRAAKIGARATWVLGMGNGEHGMAPLEEMIVTVSPAYAVVLFGTNDAVWYQGTPASIAKLFGGDLEAVLDEIERRGIIPILTTLPKHMRDKRFPDCSSTGPSNARFAIQTSAASAEVARIACQRHLPLIDYRYALDPLLDHGIGHDGVHPTVYPKGGGFLDASGLQCGFNVRNLLTLRMLRQTYVAATVRQADASVPR